MDCITTVLPVGQLQEYHFRKHCWDIVETYLLQQSKHIDLQKNYVNLCCANTHVILQTGQEKYAKAQNV